VKPARQRLGDRTVHKDRVAANALLLRNSVGVGLFAESECVGPAHGQDPQHGSDLIDEASELLLRSSGAPQGGDRHLGQSKEAFQRGREAHLVKNVLDVDASHEQLLVLLQLQLRKSRRRAQRNVLRRLKPEVGDTCVENEPLTALLLPHCENADLRVVPLPTRSPLHHTRSKKSEKEPGVSVWVSQNWITIRPTKFTSLSALLEDLLCHNLGIDKLLHATLTCTTKQHR